MFKKVLIAEDQQSISEGLQNALEQFSIPEISTVHYCDDALLKIKSAIYKQIPFDILITDLSFNKDHRVRDICSGEELIEQVKKVQPNIKIIVFSVENRVGRIKQLIQDFAIDGYILKGRKETEDIKKAIQALLEGKYYYSDTIRTLLRNTQNISDINATDTLILKLLAKGLNQKQISEYFKDNNLPSGSKRSIEYRLQDLKILFDANTLPHLISIVKDIGLI